MEAIVVLFCLVVLVSIAKALITADLRGVNASRPTYKLKKLIVLHRHGDRAQITKGFGSFFPQNDIATNIWNRLLPNEDIKQAIASFMNAEESFSDNNVDDVFYTGEESAHKPYGQLTQIGVSQLQFLGKKLSEHYADALILSPNSTYLRSTNLCRTLQSLQSLLFGLFNSLKGDFPAINRSFKRVDEVMVPQEHHCPSVLLTKRLAVHRHLRSVYPQYKQIEEKLHYLINEHKVLPWMDIYEVMVCIYTHRQAFEEVRETFQQHNITLLTDILNEEDFLIIQNMVCKVWELMYNDKEVNRVALGRFYFELLNNLENHVDKTLLIYSAHDITLVPFLAALDLYDGTVPPYGSYVAIEVLESCEQGEEEEGGGCPEYVRVVYNDNVLSLKIQDDDVEYVLYGYFLDKLRDLAIDQNEHNQICSYAHREL